MAEQRVSNKWVDACTAVCEEEADGDLIVGGVRSVRGSGVGYELESHGGCVVDDSGEVLRHLRKLCEAEEGEEGSIGTELDTDLRLGLSGDGRVELLEDLCCKS